MALVKLPSSSLLTLQPWWGEGVSAACGLVVVVFLNSFGNQKAVDSGKWSLYPPRTHPWSGPCSPFPIALIPNTTPTDWGPAPSPCLCVSPNLFSRRGKGTCPSSGIWEGPAPMGFTLSRGLSPRHIC